jgi:hypothetical protein
MVLRARSILFVVLTALLVGVVAGSQLPPPAPAPATKPFEPEVGQPGKDVVWVPTSSPVVNKMLDLAKVTKADYVVDLGSGDGRTVIEAARRGARAHGIEYNPDMVVLSKANATKAGVAARATFEQADLFTVDFSKATVLTMFLLPEINVKLRPTILDMRPGTRVVSNTFTMAEWAADETAVVEGDCTSWCTALLWIVPAKVEGLWELSSGGLLVLDQEFQVVSGMFGSGPITDGRLRGNEITFTVGQARYTGTVDGRTMKGTAAGAASSTWSAVRQ